MSISSVNHALKQMREKTKAGVPFSFTFLTFSEKSNATKGHKIVKRAVLRSGYTAKHSDKAHILIAYKDLDTNENRQFYLPLLIKYNDLCLK